MPVKEVIKGISDLYADISVCFLTLANALENTGVLSKAQLAEAT